MPNYDYQCTQCNHRFEVFQSMKDDKLDECPKCAGQVERLIGAGAGMIFKGSGFYITDYRSDSYKKGEKSDSKPAGKDKDKASSKSSDAPKAPVKSKTDAKASSPSKSSKSTD